MYNAIGSKLYAKYGQFFNMLAISNSKHFFAHDSGSVTCWGQDFRPRSSADWQLCARRWLDDGVVTNCKDKAKRRISPQRDTLADSTWTLPTGLEQLAPSHF